MFHFEEGHLRVPEMPGLGVDLNSSKVRKYADYFTASLQTIHLQEKDPSLRSLYKDLVNIPGNEP